MKNLIKLFVLIFTFSVLGFSCGPKPQYKTRQGKKKLKYYNSIQYDKGEAPKNFKNKNK